MTDTKTAPALRHPTLSAAPPAATTPATPRRGTIRTRFLLIGLIPVFTLGLPWLGYTLTVQRSNDERLLLESVSQLTSNYSERILDLEEALGLPLQEQEVITSALGRTETLIKTSALPITNVAVVNEQGQVVIAYSDRFPEGSALTDQNIVQRWEKENPTILKAVKNIASETYGDLLLAQDGFSGRINVDGQTITLASALIPGNEGVSVITVDTAYIDQRMRENTLRALLFILASLAVTLFAVQRVTTPMVRRLKRLAAGTEQASRTSYGEEQAVIDVNGNDEITDMQVAAKRLRDSNMVLSSMLEEDDR